MLAFIFTIVTLLGSFQVEDKKTVHYQIKPVPAADRTNLEISVKFEADGPVNITLPKGCYGTPNLQRYVTSFAGESGTDVKPGKEDAQRIVNPSSNGEIGLKYIISYDPNMSSTYSPNVSSDHFYVAGCHWSLQIGEYEQKHHLSIEMIDVPKNWQMYSSIASDPLKFETTASSDDLFTTSIGGGDKKTVRQFNIKGKPVSVFLWGKYAIPDTEIIAAVQKIVTLQRDWFKDYSQPFYNVVILPKEDNVAGVRINNQFTCFIKSDIKREQLYVLLAHEMLHNWMTTQIIKPAKDMTDLRYAWFYEGVNDYVARNILLEAGLLPKEKFVYLINRDIINIADNPNRAATFQDLLKATDSGGYDQAFNKLSYYRGALIAHNWQVDIDRSKKGRSLGDFIREVYNLSAKTGGISEQQLFEIAAGYGINAKRDFESHILRGEPIKPAAGYLGNLFELRESSVPSFDPGFSIADTLKTRKVTGVKENGAAYKAGLREGMEFAGMENNNRFGNAWDPDGPMVVIINEYSVKKRIEFFPRGTPHKLLLFESRKKPLK